MPTAILIAHACDGFVAVSDGLGTSGRTNSKHERKIFAAKGPSLKLMYGVSGIASILDAAGMEVLQPAYRPIIEKLAEQMFPNLGSYADAVILKLVAVLRREIQKDRQLPDFDIAPDRPMSFKIQFAGYCNDGPVLTDRKCQLWSDKWCVTTSEPLCVSYPGRYSFVGSKEIRKKLIEGDGFSTFETSGFRKLVRNDRSLTREEFIEGATKYIQACMTKEARDLDRCCESIGGDIWKATLDENGNLDVCVIVSA
jgi:hypothetical protein